MHTIKSPFIPQLPKQFCSRAIVFTESLKGRKVSEKEAVGIVKQGHFNTPFWCFKWFQVRVDVIVGDQLLSKVSPGGMEREARDRVCRTAKGKGRQLNEVGVAGEGVQLKVGRIDRPGVASPVFQPHT